MQPTISQQYGIEQMQPYEQPQPQQQPIGARTVMAITIVVILLIVACMARTLILGSATSISLPAAQPLSGVISQALGPNSDGSLPVAGTDYKLSTKYFDNNDWAVSSIKPLKNTFEASVTVLKKTGGVYQVVLDPTNALPNSELQGLPTDVSNYVHSQVAVYTPLDDQQVQE